MIGSLNNSYQYKNIPLTPAIIEELTQELFDGQLVSRQTIVEDVIKFHEKSGGAKSTAQNVIGSVKKALTNLKDKGIADNPSTGYWRIESKNPVTIIDDNSTTLLEIQLVPVETTNEIINKIADKVIGIGKSSIYLYYLPLYRQTAETQNQHVWHCKIGKTDGDPLNRILSQAATALPEKPHIALIFKTDFPSELETAIHSILTIRERKVNSSPGSEWFLTSPDEVEKLVDMILQTK